MTDTDRPDADRQVLDRSLDQALWLISEVEPDHEDGPTPCSDWKVGDLADHLVEAPAKFARMARGEEIDWSQPAPTHPDRTAAFRENAEDLRAALGEGGDQAPPPDWQTAELAVHSWDLATGLGIGSDRLDPEVADRALAFMQASLTDDSRAPVFGPEQPAPDDAGGYERLAAFAGRDVRR